MKPKEDIWKDFIHEVGGFGSVVNSPLFYPFYWQERYDSESSLFFENKLTYILEYDAFYFWVPVGIYDRLETTVSPCLGLTNGKTP